MSTTHSSTTFRIRMPRLTLTEHLYPITALTDAESAARAYRDIVQCHERLHGECEILHGDISLNNLMYHEDGDGIHGVLTDFDLSLSRYAPPTDHQPRKRPGTREFMALDHLDPKRSHAHFYRHDLESIFYVMVFHLCGYHQGRKISSLRLWEWLEFPDELLHLKKARFLSRRMLATTKHFAPLSIWLAGLLLIFHKGYAARSLNEILAGIREDEPFEEETLGGHVTFDTFMGILKLKGVE